jgi:hypothetical protein
MSDIEHDLSNVSRTEALWSALEPPPDDEIPVLAIGTAPEQRGSYPGARVFVLFAEAKGIPRTNLKIEITDRAGALIAATETARPWLYVDIPAGTYGLKATPRDGPARTLSFSVSEGSRRILRMTWWSREAGSLTAEAWREAVLERLPT